MCRPEYQELEKRLARQEENIVFLDRNLEELNDALVAAQHRMDALEQRLERAELLIRLLQENSAQGALPGHEPPPHYSARSF